MALTPRLEFRQAQSLTLTPQLMQSIKLLQYGHLELSAFVDAELERNPLLEPADSNDAPIAETEDRESLSEIERRERLDSFEQSGTIGTADSIAETYDTDVANVFPEQVGQDSLAQSLNDNRRGQSMLGTGEAPDLEGYIASRPTLAAHLSEQASHLFKLPAERLIAHYLVENLNEAGYLTQDILGIAEQLGAEEALVEDVLRRLQGCEPVGVFARDLKDCLAIQLREKDRLDPMMQGLLDNLELVAGQDFATLQRRLGADREDIIDMLAELKQLDPRPGLAFETADVETVLPDVYVRRGNGGDWELELNSDILPKVLVNRTYYASISKKTRDSAEKSFLVDCLQTANWLTKSLDQRAQTILKVATEIVKQQDGFLVHGVAHLRPMTLKAVADAIEMHESTVSRVTANKYIATPRGLFEMKYFFTTGLSSSTGGDAHSSEAVRHRIRQLIEAETAKDILSDDIIAAILKREQGMDVARRTVTKYRESMHIPSSVIRRRQKRALANAG